MRLRTSEGESPLSTGPKQPTPEVRPTPLSLAVDYYLSLWRIVSLPDTPLATKQKAQTLLQEQTTKIGLVLAKAESSSGQDEVTIQTLQHLYRYAIELSRRNSLETARRSQQTTIYTSNVYGRRIKNR
jgi:hypothetical protein